jgi:hypothetical protein
MESTTTHPALSQRQFGGLGSTGRTEAANTSYWNKAANGKGYYAGGGSGRGKLVAAGNAASASMRARGA